MVHGVLGGDAVKPHVPLIFCGEIGLFHRRNYLLSKRGVYIIVEVVDDSTLLVIVIGLCRCLVPGTCCAYGPGSIGLV